MRQTRGLIKAIILVLMLGIGANAQEGFKNLFINIHTDSHNESSMGLAVANAMQKAGVNTTVLLGADAIYFALKKGGDRKFVPTNATQQEMISSLIKDGGKVMVCGMFAKFAKITEDDVVKGVKVVGGGEVAGALLAPSTQTLSF